MPGASEVCQHALARGAGRGVQRGAGRGVRDASGRGARGVSGRLAPGALEQRASERTRERPQAEAIVMLLFAAYKDLTLSVSKGASCEQLCALVMAVLSYPGARTVKAAIFGGPSTHKVRPSRAGDLGALESMKLGLEVIVEARCNLSKSACEMMMHALATKKRPRDELSEFGKTCVEAHPEMYDFCDVVLNGTPAGTKKQSLLAYGLRRVTCSAGADAST